MHTTAGRGLERLLRHEYSRQLLRADVIAGLATGAVVGVGTPGVETVGEVQPGLATLGFLDPELGLTGAMPAGGGASQTVYEVAQIPGSNVFRPVAIDHPLDQTVPGVLILRTEGRIHVANAQSIGDRMWSLIHAARPRAVILDCSAVPDIEYTALRMLTEAEDKLRKCDFTMCLAALNPAGLQVVTASPLGRRLGRERMFLTLHEAVARCMACADSRQPMEKKT